MNATSTPSTATTGSAAFVALALSSLPKGRLLNVGSGAGARGTAHQQLFDLDIDASILRGSPSPGAAGDAEDLPFASGVFQGALLKDVLEHVPHPIVVLREVARVCAPDAEILVTVPRAVPRAVWADPTHLRGFTARSLETALTLGGWRPTGPPRRIGSVPGAGHVPFLLRNLSTILRVPGLGHLLGPNWIIRARRVNAAGAR